MKVERPAKTKAGCTHHKSGRMVWPNARGLIDEDASAMSGARVLRLRTALFLRDLPRPGKGGMEAPSNSHYGLATPGVTICAIMRIAGKRRTWRGQDART